MVDLQFAQDGLEALPSTCLRVSQRLSRCQRCSLRPLLRQEASQHSRSSYTERTGGPQMTPFVSVLRPYDRQDRDLR